MKTNRSGWIARGALCGMFAMLALAADVASGQELLKRLEDRIKSVIPRPPNPAPRPAAEGGYLGLMAEPGEGGVKVGEITGGSPADAAGLRPGDLIIGIGDQPITSVDEMAATLQGAPVGTRFNFRIRRGEDEQVVPVTLGRRGQVVRKPTPPPVAPGGIAPGIPVPAGDRPPSGRAQASLGVSLMPLTPELREQHGIDVRRGAMIEKIRPGSAADQAGLPLHGVIVAAEGQRIDSPEALIAVIKSKRPGDNMLLSYYQGNQLLRKDVRLGMAGSSAPGSEEPITDPPVVDPLPSEPFVPAPRPSDSSVEVTLLRREVGELRSEIELLRKELESLKKALSAKEETKEDTLEPAEEEAPKLRRPAAAEDEGEPKTEA